MNRFYQNKVFNPIHVPNIVMKVKPYLYCTKREKDGGIHHPEAEVKIIADIWLCIGTGKKGFQGKAITTDYIPRCEIDLEKNIITKKGELITCDNIHTVIDVIRQRVFGNQD
jgi:hypothetical protein